MKIDHDLKIWPEYYISAAIGAKKAEIRINDRNYKEGDIVRFNKYIPKDYLGKNTNNGYYAGSCLIAGITNICHHKGIKEGYVMFSFVLIELPENLNIAGNEIELRKKYGNNMKKSNSYEKIFT